MKKGENQKSASILVYQCFFEILMEKQLAPYA